MLQEILSIGLPRLLCELKSHSLLHVESLILSEGIFFRVQGKLTHVLRSEDRYLAQAAVVVTYLSATHKL